MAFVFLIFPTMEDIPHWIEGRYGVTARLFRNYCRSPCQSNVFHGEIELWYGWRFFLTFLNTLRFYSIGTDLFAWCVFGENIWHVLMNYCWSSSGTERCWNWSLVEIYNGVFPEVFVGKNWYVLTEERNCQFRTSSPRQGVNIYVVLMICWFHVVYLLRAFISCIWTAWQF